MNPKLKQFLLRWANNTVAVMVAATIVPGIHCGSLGAFIAAALLLGILNTFIRGTLVFLSLPIVVLTLGLFYFFINAFLLYAVGYFMTSLQTSFRIDSFGAAFWAGLIIWIVSGILNLLIGAGNTLIAIRRAAPSPTNRDDDNGPVIDV